MFTVSLYLMTFEIQVMTILPESTQTVREALRFSANLRQSYEIPQSEKYAYVEEVIGLLEMEDIADAIIGSPDSGLAVEQRKRVTIGTLHFHFLSVNLSNVV